MKQTEPYYDILNVRNIADERGALFVLENGTELPFNMARCFWIKDVPHGHSRGAHAHKTCSELIVAVNGHFKVDVTNGKQRVSIFLDTPSKALYIPTYTWCELHSFSPDALCLCLASQHYDAEGYINNYEEYCNIMQNQ
ncbi:MAG: FdtA/QdtA family cupin domain-containing protein [Bacteroidaceae bacterium]|nr:FdtA/QdtA family cupin domain-containing protein [Bacteroidaceae bacterium]